jgi:hypothetical protein
VYEALGLLGGWNRKIEARELARHSILKDGSRYLVLCQQAKNDVHGAKARPTATPTDIPRLRMIHAGCHSSIFQARRSLDGNIDILQYAITYSKTCQRAREYGFGGVNVE